MWAYTFDPIISLSYKNTRSVFLPLIKKFMKYLIHVKVCVCVQLVLIKQSLCICKFTYLLKLICNLKISIYSAFLVTCTHVQGSANSTRLNSSRFSPHDVCKCPFCGLVSAVSFTLLCILLVISLFKMASSVGLECCLVFLIARRLG